MCYVVYISPAVVTHLSERYASLPTALPSQTQDGKVKVRTDHPVLKLFGMEALQEAYTRNLRLLARQDWPVFLKLYNKTLNGRYIPTIKLFLQIGSSLHHSLTDTSRSFHQSLFKPILTATLFLLGKHNYKMIAGQWVNGTSHLPTHCD